MFSLDEVIEIIKNRLIDFWGMPVQLFLLQVSFEIFSGRQIWRDSGFNKLIAGLFIATVLFVGNEFIEVTENGCLFPDLHIDVLVNKFCHRFPCDFIIRKVIFKIVPQEKLDILLLFFRSDPDIFPDSVFEAWMLYIKAIIIPFLDQVHFKWFLT